MATNSYLSEEDTEFVSSFNFAACDVATQGITNVFSHSGPAKATALQANLHERGCTEEEMLEPTPIAQTGVVVVRNVMYATAPWCRDASMLDSLRGLLRESSTMSSNSSRFSFEEADRHSFGTLYADTVKDFTKRRWSDGKISSAVKCRTRTSDSDTDSDSPSSLRSSHMEQWNQRFLELQRFRKEQGHCLVPLNWPFNPSLAHWVKRQRYQFRMKHECKHSTLTDERQNELESLGFVWDSHAAGWEERWNELREFKEVNGHCNVPKKYPTNQPLSVWVKCQRRQFKLFSSGDKNSNMTNARIEKLQLLGFIFDPRSRGRQSRALSL